MKILHKITMFLISAMLLMGPAVNADLIPEIKKNGFMPLGYTSGMANKYAHSSHYGIERGRRARRRNSELYRTSFRATVDYGTRYKAGGRSCSVKYDTKTGILNVKGYNFITNHSMYIMDYDVKTKDITVYELMGRGTRSTFSVNGKVTHYDARRGTTTREKVGKDAYLAQKKKMAEYIKGGIETIDNGGVVTAGAKEDFVKALEIVTKKGPIQ